MNRPVLLLLALAAAVLVLSACSITTPPVSSDPTPGVSFRNPILSIDFPDPFILKANGRYYAYATNSGHRRVQVAVSTDLISWELLQDAMPKVPRWATSQTGLTWAPEVMKIGDRYVLYYTTRDIRSNRQCVGAASSDQPEGPFTDTNPGPVVCQSDEGGTIDASPFEDNGRLLLYFKNDGNCCGMPTRIYVQEMAADGLSMVGEPQALLVNDQAWEGGVIEAPSMVKKDGKYYLFFSANDYSNEKYAVGYALCDSPTGPCKDAQENPILKSHKDLNPPVVGPGHQAVLQIGNDTWIFYHVWEVDQEGRPAGRRQLWLDRIDWKNGKPVVVGPKTAVQLVPETK